MMGYFSYEKQSGDKAMANISPQDARQGRKGKQTRNILLISLLLLAIIWFGLEIYGSMLSDKVDAPAPSGTEQTSPAPQASPSQ